MTEQELRDMIRESIARHTGARDPAAAFNRGGVDARLPMHPSHLQFSILRSGDEDGACVIEPTVKCNHCGYCLSYGH